MNLLSSIGIGNATVDLVLPSTVVRAGEPVSATVHVDGGEEDQFVEEVHGALRTRYLTPETYRDHTLATFEIATGGFGIAAGEHREFPVTVPVPPETPVTWGRTEVWVDTDLDIDWALDPEDTDPLSVDPGPRLDALHGAFESLGFRPDVAEAVSAAGTPFGDGPPFVQHFRYLPHGGEYREAVEDVEVLADPGGGELDHLVEVDGEDDFLTRWSGADVRGTRRTAATTDPGEFEDTLTDVIEEAV